MKKLYSALLLFLGLCIMTSCASNSPVGTYKADLTLAQSGCMTTIVIRENGSATMTQDGYDTEYTYWDYAGKGKDIKIHTSNHSWYFMDFDEMKIYYGGEDYRSCKNGNSFIKEY